jgi:hypothetical protein
VREQTKYGIAVVAATIVGLAAITHQSLWIDEGAAALKAMQPTFHDWWQALRTEGNSNLQLIFQLFYLWGWEKIFGSSEYALRASNIPWFAVAAAAMVWGFTKEWRLQLGVLLLTLTNAFLWYYLSEARPYIVLFAFSSLTTACLFRLLLDESPSESPAWFRLFCLGLIGLCGTSLLAVPWAMGAIMAAVACLGTNQTRRILWRFRYCTAATTAFLIAMAAYYAWTLHLGARASDIGQTGAENILFIIYELSGLSGLGPSRLALRESAIGAYVPYLPILALGSMTLFALFAAACSDLRKEVRRREVIFFGFAVALPFLAALTAGIAGNMRLLGRHLTPLLPFILATIAVGLRRLVWSKQLWTRGIAFGAIAMLCLSAIEIRFAPRHQRDDYRAAAEEARRGIADGEKVWWAADVSTGAYYGVPLNSPALTLGSNLSDRSFETLPAPDLVCLSKPDIYDPNDKIRNYLREHNFKVMRVLPAFQIFQRQTDHH